MSEKKQRKPLSIPVFLAVYISVVVACIVLDQLSKYLIELAVNNPNIPKNRLGEIRIIGDWLTLHWTTNSGATGGMFQNLGWQNWLFFIMTIVGIPVFCWLLLRSRTRSVVGQVAFAFITGGTIGNAIDRIVFAENGFFTGEVRDFVKVEGFFGIFNIADSFLVVGVILALLAIVFFDPDSLMWSIIKDRKAKAEQTSTTETTDENAEQQVEQHENDSTDL